MQSSSTPVGAFSMAALISVRLSPFECLIDAFLGCLAFDTAETVFCTASIAVVASRTCADSQIPVLFHARSQLRLEVHDSDQSCIVSVSDLQLARQL